MARKVASSEAKQVYATLDECKAHKPEGMDKWRICKVTSPDGSTRYTWALDQIGALIRIAKLDGYMATDAAKVPSQANVAAMLAQLPAEERAALVSQYAAAAGGSGKKAK